MNREKRNRIANRVDDLLNARCVFGLKIFINFGNQFFRNKKYIERKVEAGVFLQHLQQIFASLQLQIYKKLSKKDKKDLF